MLTCEPGFTVQKELASAMSASPHRCLRPNLLPAARQRDPCTNQFFPAFFPYCPTALLPTALLPYSSTNCLPAPSGCTNRSVRSDLFSLLKPSFFAASS